MGRSKTFLMSMAFGAVLMAATVSIASAQGKPSNLPPGGTPPGLTMSATPELDSLLLFGTGLAGIAGYGALRWRARRRDSQ